MRIAIKHPMPDRVKPSSVIFDIRSAKMSKITNEGLTLQGWHRMLHTHMAIVGVKGLKA